MSYGRYPAHAHSVPSLAALSNEQNLLLDSSLSNNTWKTYEIAVECFNQFRLLYNFQNIWPIPIDDLAKFVAFLSCKNMSVSTVTTYMSGISFAHKIKGLSDNTKSFIINKMIEGLRRRTPQKPDIRSPISRELLKKLISSLNKVCNTDYESKLFAAAFSLAFFALLRVSEIAVVNSSESGHALNRNDIKFESENGQPQMHIHIASSKTDQRGNSVTLILGKQSDSSICPINLLQEYLAHRSHCKTQSNKLFVHFNGLPLTKYQFGAILKKALIFCDTPLHIRSHSFRIGRASEMAKMNISDEVIMRCGRWSSTAYSRYIRL